MVNNNAIVTIIDKITKRQNLLTNEFDILFWFTNLKKINWHSILTFQFDKNPNWYSDLTKFQFDKINNLYYIYIRFIEIFLGGLKNTT